MAETAVVYEVTSEVEPAIIEAFDNWLAEHVQAMLLLPGFSDARILRGTIPASQAAQITRVVQYTLRSQADLDNYLREQAPLMRAEGIERFGDKFHTSRRIFPAGDVSSITVSSPAALLRCLNCDTPLTGKYCTECGQPNHTYVAPLWETVEEFFGNHFGLDTKFFHSVVPLLTRPGFLTREYCAGRRERYIKPLRLYLFSSILFFFFAAWLMPANFVNHTGTPAVNIAGNPTDSRKSLQQAIAEIKNDPGLSKTAKAALLATLQDQLDALNGKQSTKPVRESGLQFMTNEAGKNIQDKSEFSQKLTVKLQKIKADPQGFENELLYHAVPKLMFLFLPLVALLLKLFYIRRKYLYMEHLIFTLHCHALFFIALLAGVLISSLVTHFGWPVEIKEWTSTFIRWYLAIYLLLALRNFYQQSWLKTIIKYCLLFIAYFVLMVFGFMGALALALMEV